MRKALYLLSFISFIFLFLPLVYGGIVVLFLVVFSKVDRKLFIIGSLLILLRLQIEYRLNPSNLGRVIELNEKSLIVESKGAKIRIIGLDVYQFAIGDIVEFENTQDITHRTSFYGFDSLAYSKAHQLFKQATYVKTIRTANPFLEWISLKNPQNLDFAKWYRALLFQSSFEGLNLFFSLGLVYEVWLAWIRRLSLKLPKWLQTILELSFLGSLAYLLFFPLTLIRVLLFRILKSLGLKLQEQLHGFILIMVMIQPYALTQLSILIPIVYLSISIYFPKKYLKLNQMNVLATLFLSFGFRVSLINLGFYSLMRKMYRYLILLMIVALVFNWFQDPMLIFLETFNDMYASLSSILIIKGQMLTWVLGLFILLSVFAHRINSLLFTIASSIIVCVIHPLSLLPLNATIHMVNVGQGDAFIFQSPFNQEVYLLDTGNQFAYSSLKNYLDGLGISHIDALIITHLDLDHSANIEALNQDFKIDVMDYSGNDYSFGQDQLKHLDIHPFNNENDDSLVYLLDSKFNFLFLADVSSQVEKLLIKLYPRLDIDVLKVAHHGSNTSSSYELLLRYNPKIALISVGKNHYGHPSLSVIERLDALAMYPLNSLEEGDVRIELKEGYLKIKTASNKNFLYFN